MLFTFICKLLYDVELEMLCNSGSLPQSRGMLLLLGCAAAAALSRLNDVLGAVRTSARGEGGGRYLVGRNQQILNGSFTAVSKPMFASKY